MAEVHHGNPVWPIAACVLAIRTMLFYSYKSTDYEVHRNWMAITHSLPIAKWYSESTSQWTLDYPPFFAYFEWLLSVPAKWIEPAMLRITRDPYDSESTTLYMRSTVLLCDVLYTLCVVHCLRSPTMGHGAGDNRSSSRRLAGAVLLIGNAALILVDSVHFQYNGLLSALLLLSLFALLEDRCYAAAFWYFVLVNMKHIYLYMAPAYAAIYLKRFCFRPAVDGCAWNLTGCIKRVNFSRCLLLSLIAAVVFAASFGPFVYHGQLGAVLGRLFPVGRGLTHAYWAPNVWSLYLALDWLMRTAIHRAAGSPAAVALAALLPANMSIAPVLRGSASLPPATYTSGLVAVHTSTVLPNVDPLVTLLSAAFVCVALGCAVKNSRLGSADAITAAAFTCYMFGYHVHEKAIVLVTIPLAVSALCDRSRARLFILVSTIGHYSLMPLFFEPAEAPIKYGLTLLYLLVASASLERVHGDPSSRFVPFLSRLELLYLCGFVPLEVYCAWGHGAMGHDKIAPFAPLMATSVYCGIGMFYSYVCFVWRYAVLESSTLFARFSQWRWRRQQEAMSRGLIVCNTERWQDDAHFAGLQYVAGVDIATAAGDDRACAVSLAIVHYPSMELVHSDVLPLHVDTPYVPGYLAFREAEPMCRLVAKALVDRPDVKPQAIMVDGNGLLHPRRFGSACHLGVLLDVPTVGVAKNLHHVAGLYRDPTVYAAHLHRRGDSVGLTDERTADEIGRAVLLGDQARNPSFVSVGHRFDLDTAERLALACSKHRVPEPIRHADFIARRAAAAWYDG